ncbi:hypothetical protein DICPUDRAFT_39573 [Dictyostelium purpureum]|uniref:F5/8 type C domain-containing protein n=1 Tax=Dictyostelium purpureum TaxID=5786 RepID=F0ZWJ8_DICPU|nr:uncharacterized protein DICPUDRAFT_39573 [Dictyostelium purpureum]EGC31689.1 hypothetical protein DICPUDRAFT_39573 [Dictyostelium purpureum]|eukprot:XP_003291787.1 hypothetical protein DICPUDRAFT_39573 [Dictyostelium purpureum]
MLQLFLSFLFFLLFKISFVITTTDYYNYSVIAEQQWENYYSSFINDLVYKSFRYNEKLNLPSYIIKNNQIQPCELYNTVIYNPSIYTIYSNIYQIKNENISQGTLAYNEDLNCYVFNSDLTCKVSLPISRCSDNDSPNVSDFNNYNNLIKKGHSFKNNLQFYYSAKQSFHYYIRSFLTQFSDIDQFNRIDNYWNNMVNKLDVLIKSIIELTQPSTPKNIGSILSSVDSSILSSQFKAKIVDQTSFTINTILDSLNSLLEIVNDLLLITPSASISSSLSYIDQSIISNIQNNLKILNDYQNLNLNIFFGSSQNFNQHISELFNSGQTLLEYYLEFTTTSNVIESIIQEVLVLNQVLLQQSSKQNLNSIIYNLDLQKFNFNKLKQQESNLSIVLKLIKSSTNINNNSNNNNNSFYCNYLIIESIIKSFNQIINPNNLLEIQQLVFKSSTFGDIGYCRDLFQRSSKLTMDLTVFNQLSAVRELGDLVNQDILSYDFGFPNTKLITSNLFSSIIKDTGAAQFQKDGLVLNVSYPSSTGKPTPQAPPGPFPIVPQNPNFQCQYPSCLWGNTGSQCQDTPSNYFYFLEGQCDFCIDLPVNSERAFLGGVRTPDGRIGISPNCPYICTLKGQYKLGDADDYNKECIDAPIGYYSPAYNNTLYKCTIPSTYRLPNRLGFGSNGFSDSCTITPLYQMVFINSNYDTERNVLPSSILDRGKTIEMWLSIQNLPSEDSVLGLTGIHGSFEISFIYKHTTKTITPAITDSSSQAIIFSDSSISIPVSNINTFFHFAVVIESNNILSFYINAKRMGKSIFSSSKINQSPGFQYIGAKQFHRMSFLIDEYHTFDQALSPSQLGYKVRSEMIASSCNAQINERLCNGSCVSCNLNFGLVLDITDCSCKCSDSANMEIVNGKCIQRCPPNSFRDSSLQCSCVDGEYKVLHANYVKISSIYQYDSQENYYSSNTDKKIGLKSVQIYNQKGEKIIPASCSSNSNDGNDCYGLFDDSASTYWCSAGFSGYGYVLFNLKTTEKISKISIEPLPNIFTMKTITISISKDSNTFETTTDIFVLPTQANPTTIDFNLVSDDLTLFQCGQCPTTSSFKESESSIQYRYPPTSVYPHNSIDTCGCFGRFSFDSFACMPPLPSPGFTLASGPYKTNTLVNIVYNIQVTTGYSLRYTIDSSDPLETSTLFPIEQGIMFDNIETVVLKVRSFKKGRLTSDVASAVYYIQGLINCTLSPIGGDAKIYDVSVTVKINCETSPSFSSISSSWIFFTTDNSEPNIFSDKYNPKYGVTLQSNPTIGMNYITFKVLSQLEKYFSFTGEFLYKIQPTIPPPTFTPPNQLNFVNYVPLKILVPSIKDSESTSISTETFYQNYIIFYDLIPQGETNPAPLTKTSGIKYNLDEYITVECGYPSEGCLLHLRAIGCINEACSVITQKFFKVSFNMTELTPAIIPKYQREFKSYLIKIQSNSNLMDLETFYNFKLLQSDATSDDSKLLNQCQKEMNIQFGEPVIKYNLPFNISSNLKGYFCVCSKNFKFYNNNLLSSLQVCKLLVYTNQMDPPIFLQHGEYIESKLQLNIYEDIRNYKHTGLFRVEVNNGNPTEESQLLNSNNIILNLSPSLSYQMFSISAIDCAKGFICSEPSNTSITLRATCPDPYVSTAPGIYYSNVTVYGYCDGGCTPVYEYLNSSLSKDEEATPLNRNSPVLSSSLFLTSPTNEETITILLMMCIDSLKANSKTLDFQYNVQKYYRPNKPTIIPGQSGILGSKNLIEMKCSSLDSRETCFILFTIRYADSISNVPLEIDAIPQNSNSNSMYYDYKYVKPFRPNIVGRYYIVAITVISNPYLKYDYAYSTEASIEISIFDTAPQIEMVPNISLFYPSASVLLTSNKLSTEDTILYYIANETDEYYHLNTSNNHPPLSKFIPFNESTTLLIKSTCIIYAFVEGKYYDLITSNSIQFFALVYDKQKEIIDTENQDNHSDNNLKYLSFLILLSAPISYLIYKSYNILMLYKYKKLLKLSKKTGLLLNKY